MAQQYIKIFDDTVLKQSVNQGFEVQRTNNRLGKFTMGELAFTRDTARLFAGTYTNLTESKDAGEIVGGSLVGNKYLGFIDSKPLIHWAKATGDESEGTAHIPLSYTQDTTFEGNTEKALLLSGSKFRTDKNKGWEKEATYNQTLDAYNGDYMYDAYNNALILFDNHIKPVDSSADRNWVMENNEQKFTNEEGTQHKETDGDYSLYRTRFENVTNENGIGNKNYPIYGDGFVVMRILEPDNVTIGYKEKVFNQDTGIENTNNYSHNYLEVKAVTPNIIFEHLNTGHFDLNTSSQIVIKNGAEVNLSKITSDNDKLVLPSTINYKDKISIKYTNDSTPAPNKSFGLSGDNGKYTAVVTDFPTLSLTINGSNATTKLIPGQTNEITIGEPPVYDDTIYLNIFDVFNYSDFGKDNDDNLIPPTGEYCYSGSSIYDTTGKLISTEQIPGLNYKDYTTDTEIEINENPWTGFILYDSSGGVDYLIGEKTVQDQDNNDVTVETFKIKANSLKTNYLSAGYNFLSEPEPIAWTKTNGTHWIQFFLKPYVVCPSSLYRGGSLTTIPSFTYTGEYTIEKLEDWEAAIMNGISTSGFRGVRIPDHASSIVCELHMKPNTTGSTGEVLLLTNANYESYANYTSDITDTDFELFSDISTSGVITEGEGALNKYKFVTKIKNTQYEVRQFELPLYRDGEGFKFFSFAVITNDCGIVVRAIGYRA